VKWYIICAIMECKVLHQTSPESPGHQPCPKRNETVLSSPLRKMLHSHSKGQPQFRDNKFLIFRCGQQFSDLPGYKWIWWCPFPWSSAATKLIHDYKPLVPQLQKDVQAVYKRKHFQQKAQTFKSLISQCEASCCVHKIGSNWNLTNEMIGKITDNDSGL